MDIALGDLACHVDGSQTAARKWRNPSLGYRIRKLLREVQTFWSDGGARDSLGAWVVEDGRNTSRAFASSSGLSEGERWIGEPAATKGVWRIRHREQREMDVG